MVQPLGEGLPLDATADVTRIESNTTGGEGRAPARTETARRPTSEAGRRNGHTTARSSGANGHAAARPVEANGHAMARPVETIHLAGSEQPGTSLAALIQEAESLHAALADAKSRTAPLISGLRRQRKQSRLVQETLRSLRDLKLQDVAA
jgi:hypothetical protein